MNKARKSVFILIIALAILLALTLSMYFVFFQKKSSDDPPNNVEDKIEETRFYQAENKFAEKATLEFDDANKTTFEFTTARFGYAHMSGTVEGQFIEDKWELKSFSSHLYIFGEKIDIAFTLEQLLPADKSQDQLEQYTKRISQFFAPFKINESIYVNEFCLTNDMVLIKKDAEIEDFKTIVSIPAMHGEDYDVLFGNKNTRIRVADPVFFDNDTEENSYFYHINNSDQDYFYKLEANNNNIFIEQINVAKLKDIDENPNDEVIFDECSIKIKKANIYHFANLIFDIPVVEEQNLDWEDAKAKIQDDLANSVHWFGIGESIKDTIFDELELLWPSISKKRGKYIFSTTIEESTYSLRFHFNKNDSSFELEKLALLENEEVATLFNLKNFNTYYINDHLPYIAELKDRILAFDFLLIENENYIEKIQCKLRGYDYGPIVDKEIDIGLSNYEKDSKNYVLIPNSPNIYLAYFEKDKDFIANTITNIDILEDNKLSIILANVDEPIELTYTQDDIVKFFEKEYIYIEFKDTNDNTYVIRELLNKDE